MPAVSVIIPTYNRSDMLARAVRSILGQTFGDFEIIIVDDCSTDDTESRIRGMGSPQIVYLKNDSNFGAQASRRRGVGKAAGDYVCFLDSDDEWYTDKLQKQLDAFGALPASVGVVHTGCDIFYEDTEEKKRFDIPKLSGNIYGELLRSPGPMYQCIMVRRECLEETPDAIDPGVPSFQEWDFSINMARKYDFHFIDEPLVLYHRHGGETISYDKQLEIKGYLYIVEKHRYDILERCGQSAFGMHYLGVAKRYMSVGNYASAREYFSKAVQFDVKDTFARVASQSPIPGLIMIKCYLSIKETLYTVKQKLYHCTHRILLEAGRIFRMGVKL